MNKVEVSEAHKKLVWRYVETWRRWRKLPDGYRSFADLEDDLAKGYGMLLCGLLIEPQASHAIDADVKDPKFFAAILRDDDRRDARYDGGRGTPSAAVHHPR